MTSEPRSEVVSFPEPNKGGCVEMQVASDFRDLSIWLFLGVELDSDERQRDKRQTQGERVWQQNHLQYKMEHFPSHIQPRKF